MLHAYDYKIVYKPGKSIAHVDFLSRMPLPELPSAEDVVPAGIYLFEEKDLAALTAEDIAEATKKDQGRPVV